jgi:hypothetical protein
MSEGGKTFVDKCLSGEALLDDIDDYIDRWHEGDGDPDASLSSYLGFTDEEYKLWAEKPNTLAFILNARKKGVPLTKAEDYVRSYQIAARGLSGQDIEELTQWLKQTGRIPR